MKIDSWRKFYEHDAQQPYDERKMAHARLNAVFSEMMRYGRGLQERPLQYLDIGFTDGYLLSRAEKSRIFRTHGLDIAQKAIERLQPVFNECGLRTIFKQGSITGIPFDDNMFRLVTACEILEHVDPSETDTALSQIHKSLAKGGICIATVPFRENVGNKVKCFNCGTVFAHSGHQQSFDEETLKNLFVRNNFRIQKIKRIYCTDMRLKKLGWAMPFVKLAARLFQVDSLTKLLLVARKP